MKVTFQIEGGSPVVIECNAGDNLLELARRANVAIDAPCSGNGSCGKCRVKLVEGSLNSPKTMHISEEEYDIILNTEFPKDVFNADEIEFLENEKSSFISLIYTIQLYIRLKYHAHIRYYEHVLLMLIHVWI